VKKPPIVVRAEPRAQAQVKVETEVQAVADVKLLQRAVVEIRAQAAADVKHLQRAVVEIRAQAAADVMTVQKEVNNVIVAEVIAALTAAAVEKVEALLIVTRALLNQKTDAADRLKLIISP